MDAEQVAAVRRFNRTVTQRVGALDDEYMARGRPLAQARLLWEIGIEGAEVAALRARLGLDSGYLSRLLRALESDGLVAVGPGDPVGATGGSGPPRSPTPVARSGLSSTDVPMSSSGRSSNRSPGATGNGWWRRWPRSSVC